MLCIICYTYLVQIPALFMYILYKYDLFIIQNLIASSASASCQ